MVFFIRPGAELSTSDRLGSACHCSIQLLVRFGGTTLHELTVSVFELLTNVEPDSYVTLPPVEPQTPISSC